jgi:hypothetical protein
MPEMPAGTATATDPAEPAETDAAETGPGLSATLRGTLVPDEAPENAGPAARAGGAQAGNVPSLHHVRHGRVRGDGVEGSRSLVGSPSLVTTSWTGYGSAWACSPVPMPASNAELDARMALLSEQLILTMGEVILGRAAYERVCEDEVAADPWLFRPLDQLTSPRVARALASRLAAIERFRLWAQELDWLQREARARGLLSFPG